MNFPSFPLHNFIFIPFFTTSIALFVSNDGWTLCTATSICKLCLETYGYNNGTFQQIKKKTLNIQSKCYKPNWKNENNWNEMEKKKISRNCRRKTTRAKYDPPYTKKSIIKGTANSNHHSVEEVSLDDSNKLITYGNTFR